jgi:hypothetical protein
MTTTIDDIYAGDYITADELPDGRRVPAVIVYATVEEVGQDQRKRVVLTLRAPDGRPWPRKLVLNKTNAGLIAAVAGKEFSTWPGRPLEVWKEPVSFQGKIVNGVKVSAMPSSVPTSYPCRRLHLLQAMATWIWLGMTYRCQVPCQRRPRGISMTRFRSDHAPWRRGRARITRTTWLVLSPRSVRHGERLAVRSGLVVDTHVTLHPRPVTGPRQRGRDHSSARCVDGTAQPLASG